MRWHTLALGALALGAAAAAVPPRRDSGRLVYDGDCGFCTTSAGWVRRHQGTDFEVVAWQDLPDLAAVGLTLDDVARSAWWIGDGMPPVDESRSIAAGLQRCRRPWPLVGRILDLPSVQLVARPGYRLVARNRYLLPGATAACAVPPR